MASFGRLLAEGATNFAAGVYKNMDSQAGKTVKKALTSKGVSGEAVSKMIANTKTTGAYKAGVAFGKSAPMQGITGSVRNMTNNMHAGKALDVKGSIAKAHMKQGTQQLDMKKVAGTAATIGVAGRVATGGGLYRDRYGNVNVPGLPFI